MTTWLDDPTVAVVRERPYYARTPPYPPSDAFPEWPDLLLGGEDNPAYRAVRLAMRHLDLDGSRYGSAEWNPLADLVHPGDTVAIKPNLVSDRNMRRGARDRADIDCLVTHGSFIRAVIDYVAKALRGRGRIIVGDCPVQGAHWLELVKAAGLDAVIEDAALRFPGIDLSACDYRLTRVDVVRGQLVARHTTQGDAESYREVDLGTDSLLVPLMQGSFDFGVAQYPRERMRRAHTPTSNCYIIPRDLLEADVLINLPKLKGHQKAGITCALKNLVGINGHKDYLPHFRYGSPKSGGDEYPDGGALWDLYWSLVHKQWDLDPGVPQMVVQMGAFGCGQVLRRALGVPRGAFARGGGSWYANDTLWRTVLDVNRAFLHYDRAAGALGIALPRRYLALADGLVGGERESPLAPSPVGAGLVLAARNPLALDTVAAAMMGLDWKKLPQIARAWDVVKYPLAAFGSGDIVIRGCPELQHIEDVYGQAAFTRFEPSVGWKGHVEFEGPTGGDSRREASAA